MTTITREQAQKIIEAADEVISALAGTNEDVHPGSDNMLRLWDDLNDRHAPPEVVRELARIALASLEAEPVAYQYRQWDAECDEWGEWEGCGECAFERFVEEEKCQGAGVQTRKLYAAPPVQA